MPWFSPPDQRDTAKSSRVPVQCQFTQSGLLETGAALSRRHRVHDHPEPRDRNAVVHWRQVRHDLPVRGVGADAEGREEPGAAGGLRTRTGQCQHQSHRQPRDPPFDNPELRKALAYALDRKSFIDILAEGQGDIGGAMQPLPAGQWGLPADMLETLPGYGPDVAKNREEARKIMASLGYGPDKQLAVKVSARNIPIFRDPAVILIDQLKPIWIDGELDPVDTANWFPKVARNDYQIGLNNTGSGVDDPDQQFYENYGCGSERNYTGYCNRELEKVREAVDEADQEKRKRLVWDIDKKLQEDGGAADHLSLPRRDLLAAATQGRHDHGQQPIQWLAHGRLVARPIVWVAGLRLSRTAGFSAPFRSLPGPEAVTAGATLS